MLDGWDESRDEASTSTELGWVGKQPLGLKPVVCAIVYGPPKSRALVEGMRFFAASNVVPDARHEVFLSR